MLKKILNPGGIPLGPLDFSTKGEHANVRTADYRKVSTTVPGILWLPPVKLASKWDCFKFQVSLTTSFLLYLIPISTNSAPSNFVESSTYVSYRNMVGSVVCCVLLKKQSGHCRHGDATRLSLLWLHSWEPLFAAFLQILFSYFPLFLETKLAIIWWQ